MLDVLRIGFGRLLGWLCLPAPIAEVDIEDLQIHIGPLFTKISVNGRDYWFDRLTGRYAGSGSDL